jgi:hypothetical protein
MEEAWTMFFSLGACPNSKAGVTFTNSRPPSGLLDNHPVELLIVDQGTRAPETSKLEDRWCKAILSNLFSFAEGLDVGFHFLIFWDTLRFRDTIWFLLSASCIRR